jgi:hypothetical protein
MKELFYLVSKLHMNGTETLTPPELVNEMLDRLPAEIWSDPTKRFLDPAMGTGTFYLCLLRRLDEGLKEVIPDRNERLRHIMAEQLWGCEIDHKQLRRFVASLHHLGLEQFERNVYNEDSLQKEWDMKFDVVVANPPYKAGLHLKFLEWAHDNADHAVFIHPSEWLVQKRRITKHGHKRRWYKELRDKLTPRCKSVTFIDNPWGKSAALFVPLSITYISNNDSIIEFKDQRTEVYSTKISKRPECTIDHLELCSQWGDGQVEKSILGKAYKWHETWKPHMQMENGDIYLCLVLLAGGGKTQIQYLDGCERTISNMWTVVNSKCCSLFDTPQRASAMGGKSVGNVRPWVSFPTEHEAQNALDFLCRTKFMRAWLAIVKIDQHAADRLMDDIPWLDWSEPWPDERINAHFGFTDEEVAWIDRVVEEISA